MSEHTKGPWKYDNYGSGITGVGKGGSQETEEEFKVADIRGWGHLQYLGHDKAVAIQEANAHLIAACPEMYKQLDEARKDLFILAGLIRDAIKHCDVDSCQGVPEVIDARLIEIRKVLAKIEGRDQ